MYLSFNFQLVKSITNCTCILNQSSSSCGARFSSLSSIDAKCCMASQNLRKPNLTFAQKREDAYALCPIVIRPRPVLIFLTMTLSNVLIFSTFRAQWLNQSKITSLVTTHETRQGTAAAAGLMHNDPVPLVPQSLVASSAWTTPSESLPRRRSMS